MMPEGLVKISSGLYNSVLPVVRNQVDSQIKVRDLSACSVRVAPADHVNWASARSALLTQRKRGMKQTFQQALSEESDADKKAEMTATFDRDQRSIEIDVDHTPVRLDMALEIEYNFLGDGGHR